jgi:addiction module HigA family antidote
MTWRKINEPPKRSRKIIQREHAAKRNPNVPPMHPGELVAEVIENLNFPISTVANALGVTSRHLLSIIQQKTRVTAEGALRLGAAFENGPRSGIRRGLAGRSQRLGKNSEAPLCSASEDGVAPLARPSANGSVRLIWGEAGASLREGGRLCRSGACNLGNQWLM